MLTLTDYTTKKISFCSEIIVNKKIPETVEKVSSAWVTKAFEKNVFLPLWH